MSHSLRPRRDRQFRLAAPQRVIDQLKPGSMIISGGEIMTTEEYEHRAWLQHITDRVNRRLGNR
mgnify:CR=1 FL=1